MGGRGGSGTRSARADEYRGEVRYHVKDLGGGAGEITAYQDVKEFSKFGRYAEKMENSTREVGSLVWNSAGKVHDIEVRGDRQRMGIGSEMWRRAQKASGGRLRHSEDRTELGDAFARKVGGKVPRRSDWRG